MLRVCLMVAVLGGIPGSLMGSMRGWKACGDRAESRVWSRFGPEVYGVLCSSVEGW
jgi:hypothetical protein